VHSAAHGDPVRQVVTVKREKNLECIKGKLRLIRYRTAQALRIKKEFQT
jgi:hypothetical protein